MCTEDVSCHPVLYNWSIALASNVGSNENVSLRRLNV